MYQFFLGTTPVIPPAEGSGVVVAVGALAGVGGRDSTATGNVVAVASIAGVGYRESSSYGEVACVAQLTGTGYRDSASQGTLVGIGVLTGTGYRESASAGQATAIGALPGVGHIVASGYSAAIGVGVLVGVGDAPSTGVATRVFLQGAVDAANSASYTFASQNLGTAAAGRYIVVCVHSRATTGSITISSVTVAGITASEVVARVNNTSSNGICAIYMAAVPTGTTGDVVVTFGATQVRCVIEMYSLTGIDPTAHDTDSSVATAPTANLDIPAGGVAIAPANMANSSSYTWTGLTEDHDTVSESQTFSSASFEFATLQTGLTITATPLSSATNPIGVFASWGPSEIVSPSEGYGSINAVALTSGIGYRESFGGGPVVAVSSAVGVGYRESASHGELESIGLLSGVGYITASSYGQVIGVGVIAGIGSGGGGEGVVLIVSGMSVYTPGFDGRTVFIPGDAASVYLPGDERLRVISNG